MITATIYTITHPAKPGDVYIGQTLNPAKRWDGHARKARDTRNRLYNWWRARVRETGIEPAMAVLVTFETSDRGEAFAWMNDEERQRIAAARADVGCRCMNSTAGGDRQGDPTPDTRARMSAAKRGTRPSLLARERMAAAQRGRKHSPETRAKISASQVGKIISPEAAAKVSAANKGRKASPEARAKMSAAHRGKQQTPELIEKRAATHRGKKRSPLTCLRISAAYTPERRERASAAQKGKKYGPDVRARMSEAQRARAGTPADKERRSAAHKGKKASPETRARMSAVHLNRNALRRFRREHAPQRRAIILACIRAGRPIEDARAFLALYDEGYTIAGAPGSDTYTSKALIDSEPDAPR